MPLSSPVLRRLAPSKVKADINMVPFIDVMLVLLIILMVASTNPSSGLIDLPTMAQTKPTPQRHVVVEIIDARQSLVYLNGTQPKPARIDQLTTQVRALAGTSGMPVVISAKKGVPYDDVATAVSELRQAGQSNVGLAFKPIGGGAQ